MIRRVPHLQTKIKLFLGSDDNVQEICDQCKPEILNISAKLDEQQGLNERLEIQVRRMDSNGFVSFLPHLKLTVYFSRFPF